MGVFNKMVVGTTGLAHAIAMSDITLHDEEKVIVTLPSLHAFKNLRAHIEHDAPKSFCNEYQRKPNEDRFEFRGIVFTFKAER